MLLEKSNFTEEQKVLVLSIALSQATNGTVTPEHIEAAIFSLSVILLGKMYEKIQKWRGRGRIK